MGGDGGEQLHAEKNNFPIGQGHFSGSLNGNWSSGVTVR